MNPGEPEMAMTTLTLQVGRELASMLEDEARHKGLPVEQYAESLLRQTLENDQTTFGLRQRPVMELLRLGREQGAEPVARFEELLGHSWPEEEDVDEFIASTRRWRREGRDE